MRVIIADSAAEVAEIAANTVAAVIRAKRSVGQNAVFGLATGSSPMGTYRALAALVNADELDVDGLTCFALDEYVGLEYSHPESYHAVIAQAVTTPLRLDPSRVHVPDGLASDPLAACDAYEAAIAAAGGIDVQLVGIGTNGHIGFNEPTSSLMSRTRFKTLSPQTRADNARFFDSIDAVPKHCLTQGIGTVLDARKVILVAQGAGKADAIAAMIEGPLTSMCPASALQLHRDATVIIDREAASKLQLTEYYDYITQNQPPHVP